jgi:hypothetical protein
MYLPIHLLNFTASLGPIIMYYESLDLENIFPSNTAIANLAGSCIMTSELVLFHHRQASIELTRYIQPFPAIKQSHLIQSVVYTASEMTLFRLLSKSLLLLFL